MLLRSTTTAINRVQPQTNTNKSETITSQSSYFIPAAVRDSWKWHFKTAFRGLRRTDIAFYRGYKKTGLFLISINISQRGYYHMEWKKGKKRIATDQRKISKWAVICSCKMLDVSIISPKYFMLQKIYKKHSFTKAKYVFSVRSHMMSWTPVVLLLKQILWFQNF